MLPTIPGAAVKRSGTRFVYAAAGSGVLIPFEFNATDAHVLLFTETEMRVFTNGGIQLETALSISAATQANPVAITTSTHGYSTGDQVYIDSIVGMTELNGRLFTITVTGSTTFTLDGEDGTGYAEYGSAGTASRVFVLTTPYAAADLGSVAWRQINDVTYLVHPDYPPQKLQRNDDDDWTIAEVDFDVPPFRAENTDEDDLIVASVSTAGDLVSGSVSLLSTGGHFASGHVGGYVKLAERYESNHREWQSTLSVGVLEVSVGSYIWYEGQVYVILSFNGNTTGCGSLPPTHESGTRSDVKWTLQWVHSGFGYIQIDTVTDAYNATGTVIADAPVATGEVFYTITSISNATPPVVTLSASHDYQTGDSVWIQGVTGAADVFNGAYYPITDTGGATFSLTNESASGTGSGGTAIRVKTGDSTSHYVAAENTWRDHDLWAFSAFSEENGYPRAITFFEDRLWPMGTTKDPTGAWGSKTGEYEDFKVLNRDDSALMVTLATGNPIEWATELSALVAGTAGEEFASPRDGSPLAADTVHTIRRKSGYGSRRGVQPVAIEDTILMVPRGGLELRELVFNIDSGDLSAANLAILAEHLTRGKIQSMAFQSHPSRVLWVVLEDGSLRAMTYERAEQVIGWWRVTIGGTDVLAKSVAVIPDSTGTRDDVWLLVSRTVNGSSVVYVEYVTAIWNEDTALEDAFFVDSGLTFDGETSTGVINGLEHLEGEDLSVLVEGEDQSSLTVSSGAITVTLPTYAGSLAYWDLNGTDEFLANTTAQSIGIADAWSIAFWARIDDTSSSTVYFIHLRETSSSNNQMLIAWSASGNHLQVKCEDSAGTTFKTINYDSIFRDGEDAHILVTYDGSDTGDPIVLYKNGVVITPNPSTDNTGTMTDSNRRVYIGNNSGGVGPLDGAIQHLAIFSTVKTATEAATLNSQKRDDDPMSGFSPVHFWTPTDPDDMGLDYGSGSIDIMENASNITSADDRVADLLSQAITVHAGLPYSGQLQSQNIESGSASGTAQGKIQRIREMVFRLYQTGTGLQYGPSLTELFENYSIPSGTLYDGDTEPLLWPSGYERGVKFAISHATPLPCTLLAAYPKMTTEDQ